MSAQSQCDAMAEKRSIYIRADGGLQDGDSDVVTLDPNAGLVASNVRFSKDGAASQMPPFEVVAEINGDPSGIVPADNGVIVVGNGATFVSNAGLTREMNHVSLNGYISESTDISFGTNASSVCPSFAVAGDYELVASWDYKNNRCHATIRSPGSIDAYLYFDENTYCPKVVKRVTVDGAASFFVVCKYDTGPSSAHTLRVYTVNPLDGSYTTTAFNSLVGGFSRVYRNAIAVASHPSVDTLTVYYTHEFGTASCYAVLQPGTSAVLFNQTMLANSTVVYNCFSDPVDAVNYVVVSNDSIAGEPYLVKMNRATSAYIEHVAIQDPDEPAYAPERQTTNIVGICVQHGSPYSKVFVLRAALERDPLPLMGETSPVPYDVNFGDTRSFPGDLSAFSDAYPANRMNRNYTVASVYTVDLDYVSTFYIPGVGVIGNGVIINDECVFPFEWGFPSAKDNVGPGSGSLTFNGKPMPYPSEVSSDLLLPFSIGAAASSVVSGLRPSWWRPVSSDSAKYPTPSDSAPALLGASLLEQELQAHWNFISQNATANYQEGRLGVHLRVAYDASPSYSLVSHFQSTRLTSRSNYAPYRAVARVASPLDNTVMNVGKVETSAAQATSTIGATISPCNIVESDGEIVNYVCTASRDGYYARGVTRVHTKTSKPIVSNGSNLVTAGGIISYISGGSASSLLVPRPSGVFIHNPLNTTDELPVASTDYSYNVVPLNVWTTAGDSESSVCEFGFLFVRYRVTVGNKTYISQLSPPLMARTENNTFNSWGPGGSDFLTLWKDGNGVAAKYPYHQLFGPVVRGIIQVGDEIDSDFRVMRNPVCVPAIPWVDDASIELDVYIDDYGTRLTDATAEAINVDLGFIGLPNVSVSKGYRIGTFSLDRVPIGQPRYVGTVKPQRLVDTAWDRTDTWLAFYFGTLDIANPQPYELGSFAPVVATGGSEPIAADALEAQPTAPPPFRNVSVYEDRVIGISADVENEIWVSKPSVGGAAHQFSDELVFRAPSDGDRVVGCAALEGRLIVFRQESVLQSIVQLPDATGGGEMQLSPATTETGCISDRSIAATPAGIVFEGQRGFLVVTPAGGIDLISGPVSSACGLKSAQNCVSVCVNKPDSEVWFAMASSPDSPHYILVWNYRFNRWSRVEGVGGVVSICYSGGSVWGLLNDDGDYAVWRSSESLRSTSENSLTGECLISTGWIKPNMAAGYGRITKAQIVGVVEGADGSVSESAEITVKTYVDYSDVEDCSYEFNILDSLLPSGELRLIVYPKTQKAQAFRFEVYVNNANEVEGPLETSGTISIRGVQVDVASKAGTNKNVVSSNKG